MIPLALLFQSREGQFLIPINAFKYDKAKLETMFYSVVREAEKYVPRVEDEFAFVDRHGLHMPDTYAIKSVGFTGNNTGQVIPTIFRPMHSRYWNWDKHSHILQTQIPAHYLIKCLKYYTFKKLHYLDELGMPLFGQEEFTGKLKAEPDITSLRFKSGPFLSVYDRVETISSNESIVYCEGDLGTVQYNTDSRMATVMLEQPIREPIVAEYLTAYKGFQELELGTNNLFTDWFAAEVFSGIGSLQCITQLEQSPIKWNAPNLIEYGRNLRQQVFERRSSQMSFFEWLP